MAVSPGPPRKKRNVFADLFNCFCIWLVWPRINAFTNHLPIGLPRSWLIYPLSWRFQPRVDEKCLKTQLLLVWTLMFFETKDPPFLDLQIGEHDPQLLLKTPVSALQIPVSNRANSPSKSLLLMKSPFHLSSISIPLLQPLLNQP